VPIEAYETGPGSGIDSATLPGIVLKFADILQDTTWRVERIVCSEGTERESDTNYLARFRQDRVDRRRGYVQAITSACLSAGASHVVLFESNRVVRDEGVNKCFVCDAGFNYSESLSKRCRVAVDNARVAGCDMTVYGMVRELCKLDVTVRLWSEPSRFNQDAVRMEAVRAVERYFDGAANPYVFRFDGVLGEIARSVPELQYAFPSSPEGAPPDTDLEDILRAHELKRLYTNAGVITIRLVGPE
jgi:hypothetical protein